jgi:hypothetical protein
MSKASSWIKVGALGTFARGGELFSSPEDIDYLLGLNLDATPRILIHFHGGLVTESQGKQIAENMASHYGSSTCSLGIIWETGMLKTFRDNLERVGSTRVFKKALSWILATAMPELSADGGARGMGGTALDQRRIEGQLETEAGVQALDSELAIEADGDGSTATARGKAPVRSEKEIAESLEFDLSSDTEIVDLIESGADGAEPIQRQLEIEKGARGATLGVAYFFARVVVAVWSRYRTGTHHDPLPTAVEELLRAAYLSEIGAFAWSSMKDKAKRMWIDDGVKPDGNGHIGGYLLRRLELSKMEHPDLTIDLVGHSAGSVAICAMLEAIKAQGRKVKVRNVIFLAPAVRLDVFREAVTSPQPFERFRLFTMNDECEKADRLVGAVYPRSLLFLVSGLFEDKPGVPLAGLARHIIARTVSAGEEYDGVRRWLATENRIILSPSPANAGEGLRSQATRHGDFDNDAATLSSLLFLARASS